MMWSNRVWSRRVLRCLVLALGGLSATPAAAQGALCSRQDGEQARHLLEQRRRLVAAGGMSRLEFLQLEQHTLDTLECAGLLSKSQYCADMTRNLRDIRQLIEALESGEVHVPLGGDYFEKVAWMQRYCRL